MKNRILTFIIGILTGAIIMTTGFLIYNRTTSKNSRQLETLELHKNEPMEREHLENMEEPPEKPKK